MAVRHVSLVFRREKAFLSASIPYRSVRQLFRRHGYKKNVPLPFVQCSIVKKHGCTITVHPRGDTSYLVYDYIIFLRNVTSIINALPCVAELQTSPLLIFERCKDTETPETVQMFWEI